MAPELALSRDSTIVATSQQVSYRLDGEAVVLDLGGGVYYSLNPVAARVWDLINRPRTVTEILGVLLHEYDVDAERCEQDLLQLLRELAARDLIAIEAA